MPNSPASLPNLILFEDEHLLVVNKPAGWNTHAPSPFAGEGVYDWLRHREPRWATLAIIQRLDKETSGVMVFAKSREANRSLTAQFTGHAAKKKYLLATDRPVKRQDQTVVSTLRRAGERYVSSPWHPGAERAETRFRMLDEKEGHTRIEAMPVTGRTHQIRVHAAASGFPILGDELYGGTPAARVHLHAAELTLRHPVTNEPMTFAAPAEFAMEPGRSRREEARFEIQNPKSKIRNEPSLPESAPAKCKLREAIINPAETTAFRLSHGAADGWPGGYVDRLGDFVLVQSADPPGSRHEEAPSISGFDLSLLTSAPTAGMEAPRGVYHKRLNRQVRQATAAEVSPQLLAGAAAPERFEILENGVRFELGFNEGYSVGLFLDQRDNRRRFLVNHVAAGFPLFARSADLPVGVKDRAEPEFGAPAVLNTFAYTCGFSVCAAKAGARVTSLDLSRKYLDWGRRNFALNGLDADAHDFIYGDTFDWLRRLAKKGRAFDAVVLDPPTFSQSKESGVFRAEKDYAKLVAAALPVLKPGGVLLASTNAAALEPEDFLRAIEQAVSEAQRRIVQRHYAPQPPDFPVTRAEPAYLKTVWVKVI